MMNRQNKSKSVESILVQCTECGSEECNLMITKMGTIGVFCAVCLNEVGTFGGFDDLYPVVKEDREYYAKKVAKQKAKTKES